MADVIPEHESFRDYAERMAREYVAEHGSVSIDFCTTEDGLDGKLAVLREIEPILKSCTWEDNKPRPSVWHVFHCETCKDYGKGTIHVMATIEAGLLAHNESNLMGRREQG